MTTHYNLLILLVLTQNGWFEVVKLLLLHGADVTSELYDGSTALIAACYGGYTEIAELLIEHDEVKRRLKQISRCFLYSLTWCNVTD
jgi:ankyrin repeat protein